MQPVNKFIFDKEAAAKKMDELIEKENERYKKESHFFKRTKLLLRCAFGLVGGAFGAINAAVTSCSLPGYVILVLIFGAVGALVAGLMGGGPPEKVDSSKYYRMAQKYLTIIEFSEDEIIGLYMKDYEAKGWNNKHIYIETMNKETGDVSKRYIGDVRIVESAKCKVQELDINAEILRVPYSGQNRFVGPSNITEENVHEKIDEFMQEEFPRRSWFTISDMAADIGFYAREYECDVIHYSEAIMEELSALQSLSEKFHENHLNYFSALYLHFDTTITYFTVEGKVEIDMITDPIQRFVARISEDSEEWAPVVAHVARMYALLLHSLGENGFSDVVGYILAAWQREN